MARCLHSSWFFSICLRCFRLSTNTITPCAVLALLLSPLPLSSFPWGRSIVGSVLETEYTEELMLNSSGELRVGLKVDSPDDTSGNSLFFNLFLLVLFPSLFSRSLFIKEILLKSFSADKSYLSSVTGFLTPKYLPSLRSM